MSAKPNGLDQVHHQLTRSVAWSGKNLGWIASVVVVFLVGGAGFALYSGFRDKKETELQETYYKTERAYSDKKRDMTQKNAGAPKAADLEKDLGTIPQDFEKVVTEHPNSQAGRMAALQLIEIYTNYGQTDKAIATFDKLGNIGTGDLTQSLLLFQKGNVLANADRCADALPVWEQVINDKKVTFFKREAQLRKALCLEKTGNAADAEKIYTELAQLKKANPEAQQMNEVSEDDAQVAGEAQKYLRLLQMKKGS